MKQTELSKYHQMSSTQLLAEVTKQEMALAQSRLEQQTGKLKNLHLPSHLRHHIARLKTLHRLKQLTLKKTTLAPVVPQTKPQPPNKRLPAKTKTTKKDSV